MELFVFRRVCLFWLVHYVGQLGCFFIWWSIELDHRWQGEWRFVWETLGDIGDVLRAVPARAYYRKCGHQV